MLKLIRFIFFDYLIKLEYTFVSEMQAGNTSVATAFYARPQPTNQLCGVACRQFYPSSIFCKLERRSSLDARPYASPADETAKLV